MAIRRHVRMPLTPPETEALVELQAEQRRLADELEATFLAYDRRLKAAARQIASFGEEAVNAEAQERLREEQLALWRLVRRAQVADRNTRALLREAAEWRSHEPTEAAEGHPDHPETRVEIVESELRVRGVGVTDGSDKTEENPVSVQVPQGIHWLHRVPYEEEGKEAVVIDLPEWEHETDAHLLREIRHQERELLRTTRPADIVDLLKGLRTLHGHLRVHDRRESRSRIRYTLGLGMLRH